jgi:Dolichyl-phosphate-mannose-protein mannosyltransferase
MLIHIFLSSALFIISLFGPGLVAVRYFKWDNIEKVVCVIGVSLIFNYLAAFSIYIIDFPQWVYFIQALINVILFISYYKTFRIFLQDPHVLNILSGFLVIICWLLLFNTLISSFSGGTWRNDWYEHFHRTLFFLDRLPIDTIFIDLYILPARPPLMNLLGSYYLAIFGNNFYVFQHIFTLLNALVFFPVYLFASKYFSGNINRVLLVVIFLMFNPLFVQNATYTWTKLLTAFFVLYSLYLYISSWESRDKKKLSMAGIMMAGGILTHYSAIPYALFLFLHYLTYVFWMRKDKVKEIFINAIFSIALLLTWFAWSLKTYNINGTLLSNTSVTDSTLLSLVENLFKIFNNIYYTLTPHFMSGTGNWAFRMQDALGYSRDFMFFLYQTNLYFAFGSMGLIIIAYITTLNIIEKKFSLERYIFWFLFITFNIILGIAVHGKLALYGLTHICLQPIILLGTAFIASNFYKLPKLGRLIIIGGLVLDLLLGIILHLYVQNITPNDSSTIWDGLSESVHYNWNMKISNQTTFISDYLINYQSFLWCVLIIIPVIAFIQLGRTQEKPLE